MKKLNLLMLIGIMSLSLSSCKNNSSSLTSDNDGYNITYVENENCSIDISKEKAYYNEKITVLVNDIETNYVVDKITVNDLVIDDNSFYMPNEDVVVKVYLVDISNASFDVFINKSEYAVISTNQSNYKVGEKVVIDYTTKGDYILDKFYINDKEIRGTSFNMPSKDVVITGTFKKAIESTNWQVAVESGTNIGRSHWYFSYGETSLNVKVKVEDRFVCGIQYADNAGWQDNVELILTEESNVPGWNPYKTYKFIVSCEGWRILSVASSSLEWTDIWEYNNSDFSSNVVKKYLSNNDGYNGYEVNMSISYSLLGLTKDTALGNISACIAMRNVNAYGASEWSSYAGDTGSWENCSSHPLITEDGNLLERR